MELNKEAEKATALIGTQLDELHTIVERARDDKDFEAGRERLRRWKSRTVKLLSEQIHPKEGEKLKKKYKLGVVVGQPLRNLAEEADMFRGFLLSLMEELEEHPEDILRAPVETKGSSPALEVAQPTVSKTVFIVHGHDEPNTLRLEKLLRERWHLEPVRLSSEPGKGRTLIEKFEQEAHSASYAIVLFTPDDLIEVSGTKYTQARPNVIFELGWFYGRLSRRRVCILFKKGTNIHSDLDGITRIEFHDSVEEKIIDLEKELAEANLL